MRKYNYNQEATPSHVLIGALINQKKNFTQGVVKQ